MNFKTIALACTAFVALSSCHRTMLISEGEQTTSVAETAVKYSEAKNYFVRNDVKDYTPRIITDQATFDSFFGMATTMGEDGKPTEIDFTRQCVVALLHQPVEENVALSVQSLSRSGNTLTLRYKIQNKGKITYTMAPCRILVVDKAVAGLSLRAVEK